MKTPMPCIELAYSGRVDMWQRVFGGKKEEPEIKARGVEGLRSMFKRLMDE